MHLLRNERLRFWLAAIGLTAFLAFLSVVMSVDKAKAADKGGPKVQSDVPYMPPAAAGWTGCGAGIHIGRANADLDLGGPPINIGSNGTTAGGALFCDVAFGVFVVGAFAEYDRVWGDLHTLGVRSDITLGARAGVLASQSALLYTHAGWSRVDGSGFDVSGMKVGAGIEVKLPNAPFFIDLRYTHAMYSDIMGSGMDVSADEIRLGLKYKFSTSGR